MHWLIHHIFLSMALRIWCMSFYEIFLSHMILQVVLTSFWKYAGTFFKVMFHLQYHIYFLHLNSQQFGTISPIMIDKVTYHLVARTMAI